MAKFNDENGYGSEVTTVKLHAVLEYGLEVNGFYRLRLEQCQQESKRSKASTLTAESRFRGSL